MKSIGELKTIEFLSKIKLLIEDISPENIVSDSIESFNERDYLTQQVRNAEEFVKHNEWLIGLEIILDNLHEIRYKLDDDILILAEIALKSITNIENRADTIVFLRK